MAHLPMDVTDGRSALGGRRACSCAVLVACAIASVGLAACGGEKRGPLAWHAAVTLSGVHGTADAPAIAMNARGDAVVVWSYSRSRAVGASHVIQAAIRPAGGAFSKPVRLTTLRRGDDAIDPTPAIDAAGDIIVVWQRGRPIHHHDDRVQAATRPAGGTFSKPVTVAPPAAGKTDVFASVAMDAAGDAIVVWDHGAPRGVEVASVVVQAATRRAGGSFSAPVDVSRPSREALAPEVAMSAKGDAVAMWEQHSATGVVVQTSLRPRGGPFAAPIDLSTGSRLSSAAELAMNDAGDATVAWVRSRDAIHYGPVQAAMRAGGGAFARPVDVTPRSAQALLPRVAMDPSGNAVIVWFSSRGGNATAAQASVRAAGGRFDAPVTISATDEQAHNAAVAMGDNGDTVAVWSRELTGAGTQSASRPAGGSFSRPVTLAPTLRSDPYQAADNAAVAVDRHGQAIAVWYREIDADSHFVVQAAISETPGG